MYLVLNFCLAKVWSFCSSVLFMLCTYNKLDPLDSSCSAPVPHVSSSVPSSAAISDFVYPHWLLASADSHHPDLLHLQCYPSHVEASPSILVDLYCFLSAISQGHLIQCMVGSCTGAGPQARICDFTLLPPMQHTVAQL